MTAPQPVNPASTFATTVGRYFTIVSVVPSLLLISFLIVLTASGAWNHEPDLGQGIRALTQLGLGGTFALILGALALGVVLHPLQFALVQFLEGYWGVSPFWTRLRENRIRFHKQRRRLLNFYGRYPASVGVDPALQGSTMLEARRLRSIYPKPNEIMPTRLGNVLRAAERTAGGAVRLDIVEFAPHLLMVAPPVHRDYVNDQRTALDLAIRSCLVCLLGFVAAVIYLWPYQLWLLVALVPLGLAWLCYLGAVSVAQEYGTALRMLLDLNRFELYDRMGMPFPANTTVERKMVALLGAFSLQRDTQAWIRYHRPPDPPSP